MGVPPGILLDLLGSLEHQTLPGPCGKTCCLLPDAASGCSAVRCWSRAPILTCCIAAGAGAGLAWDGVDELSPSWYGSFALRLHRYRPPGLFVRVWHHLK